jgi:hypothetical protein
VGRESSPEVRVQALPPAGTRESRESGTPSRECDGAPIRKGGRARSLSYS